MANRQQVNTLPLRTISDFKSKLKGGGARPNLFEVELTFPSIVGVQDENEVIENSRFLVKAANLPASTVANIDIPFRGRIFKVAGDRTIDTWSVTIINDEDFKYRQGFEQWMQLISRLENNLGATNPESYMSNATVYQLGKGEKINSKNSGSNGATYGSNAGDVATLAAYKFQDIFPTNISAIDLSYDNSDQIEEFTVEFQVNSFERITP